MSAAIGVKRHPHGVTRRRRPAAQSTRPDDAGRARKVPHLGPGFLPGFPV